MDRLVLMFSSRVLDADLLKVHGNNKYFVTLDKSKLMKAIEFRSKIRNKTIKIPDELSKDLSDQKDYRVILLVEETEKQEEKNFGMLAEEQFLSGYDDSDSIYDDY